MIEEDLNTQPEEERVEVADEEDTVTDPVEDGPEPDSDVNSETPT